MLWNAASLLSLLLAAPLVSTTNPPHNIHWISCKENGSLSLTCGTLNVPLDYSNQSSDETLQLDLVRVSAVKQPKKGSILFNPGGPGASGRSYIAGPSVYALLAITGGEYDLIGFDPRYVVLF
jgi:hypothetical protein